MTTAAATEAVEPFSDEQIGDTLEQVAAAAEEFVKGARALAGETDREKLKEALGEALYANTEIGKNLQSLLDRL